MMIVRSARPKEANRLIGPCHVDELAGEAKVLRHDLAVWLGLRDAACILLRYDMQIWQPNYRSAKSTNNVIGAFSSKNDGFIDAPLEFTARTAGDFLSHGQFDRRSGESNTTYFDILGFCQHGTLIRNTRHHAIRELIAKSLPSFYEVHQEVHCLAKDGSSRRVDIIAIDRGKDTAIIIDPIVRFETAVEQPIALHEEKKTIYDPTIEYFRDYYHIQGQIEVFGLLFGARGTIPKFSVECFNARVSRLDHIKSEEIRHRMDAEETVLNRIENKSLKWFDHVMRMGEDRWPKQIYQWKPPRRRGRGRPKKTWDSEVMEVMHKRALRTEDAQDKALED
ncbi:hypothetical protein ANN_06366 [Periplaneta americana]|uniref:Uncharacterized protein n=1 Tax=Periplaneta americana TaxID=6978 RepID=A0ABQ8TEY4_PERAM|nr:hypothetical protein ANN_06366 [Periplaneta americana]